MTSCYSFDKRADASRVMEAVLILVPFGLWCAGSLALRNTVALPRGFMYEFVSVYDNDHQIIYPGDALAERMNADKGRTIDFTNAKLYANMNKLQTAKYGSMCYGNREDMHLSMQHYNDLIGVQHYTELVHTPQSIWSRVDAYEPTARELVRSLLLEKWQRETEGGMQTFFGSRSFCTCIDEMHFSLVDREKLNTKKKGLIDTISRLQHTNASWLSETANSLKNHSLYEHIVLNQIDYSADKTLQEIVVNMRSINLLLDSDDMQVQDEDDIIKFCNRQALPTQTMKFDGIMDSWRYICLGQFILLLSCIVSYEIAWHNWEPETQEEKDQKKTESEFQFNRTNGGKTDEGFSQWANTIFSVLRALFYVTAFAYIAVDTTRVTFSDEMRLTQSKPNLNPAGKMSIFNTVSNIDSDLAWMTIVFWVILLAGELCKWIIVKWSCDKDNEDSRPIVNRLVYTVLQDVLNIFALTILSVGVQIQMGVKELSTIYVVAVVVGSTAFIQHISNLIGIYFDWIAHASHAEIDSNILTGNAPSDLKKILLRVCYIRSGIFLFILLITIFVVAHVGVTRAVTPVRDVKSMTGLLFGIVFFVILCGFDFVYELFNVRSDGLQHQITAKSKRWLHVMFVGSYIVFFNSLFLVQR